jgi:hypothetical protein
MKPRTRTSDGKHKFLDPDERTRIAARWEKEKPKKIAPSDPEAKRKLADWHLAQQAAAPPAIPTVPAERYGLTTREAVKAWNASVTSSVVLNLLETNQRRGKKPLNMKRAVASVKRMYKPPRRYRARPEPHDAATLIAFERRHGEDMRRLATGWAPYRTAGKLRGPGISLKRFAEQARPAKGQKKYTDADRAAFRDRAESARVLLDVFAVEHTKQDLIDRARWRETQAMHDRIAARKIRRRNKRT